MSRSPREPYRGRVLLAKPGLDGHDRGALVIMRALRDAGFEVIYTGRRQTSAQIAVAAIQESVDVIGLSILSGSHVELSRRVLAELARRDAADIPVVVGGTVRPQEHAELERLGVAAVFPTGTPLAQCVEGVARVLAEDPEDPESVVSSHAAG
ncbi:MAG TPA: cobalamin B12-binding domain-containing protein [Mycobacteriales bacterium]|nr:cobalamin B12-binding domain-containing protein [Mycobacteriales bacterium]